MTDFFAAYLFLALAIILLCIGIWFKKTWLFLVSGLAWLVVGVYAIVNASGAVFVDILGVFCIFVGFAVMGAGIRINKKEYIEEAKETFTERHNRQYDELKKRRYTGLGDGY